MNFEKFLHNKPRNLKRTKRISESKSYGEIVEPTYQDYTYDDYHTEELDVSKLGTLLALATKDNDIIRAAEKINDFANEYTFNARHAKMFGETLIDEFIDKMSLMEIEDILKECDPEEYDRLTDDFAGCRMEMNREDD